MTNSLPLMRLQSGQRTRATREDLADNQMPSLDALQDGLDDVGRVKRAVQLQIGRVSVTTSRVNFLRHQLRRALEENRRERVKLEALVGEHQR